MSYYPVNSMISIKSKDIENHQYFTVYNTKSEGGSSLKNGQIELMIHRQSSWDDNKGMYEALHVF